jgi:hypothetical protein
MAEARQAPEAAGDLPGHFVETLILNAATFDKEFPMDGWVEIWTAAKISLACRYVAHVGDSLTLSPAPRPGRCRLLAVGAFAETVRGR